MRFHTIKDLERLTSVKAHTIRIWEQRYHLLSPERTDTNIRTYSDIELKKLINVSFLIKNGFKISKIAQLSDLEINQIIKKIEETNDIDTIHQIWMDNIIKACIDFDEITFEVIFSHCVLKIGFEETLTKVIYPTLYRVGIMWGIDEISPAQEHFLSNLIRKKILVAIDGMLPEINQNSSTYLLFLPQWEQHDLGILYAYYLLRKNNLKVIYLGINTPYESLKDIDTTKFEAIVSFFVVSEENTKIVDFLNQMSNDFPDKKIFFAANDYLLEGEIFSGSLIRLKTPMDLVNYAKNKN